MKFISILITGFCISDVLAADKFISINFDYLTKKDIGCAIIVSTDAHGYGGGSAPPPKGMMVFAKDGIIWHGFLKTLSKKSLMVIPQSRVPACQINKEHIIKIEIMKTEQDAAANP